MGKHAFSLDTKSPDLTPTAKVLPQMITASSDFIMTTLKHRFFTISHFSLRRGQRNASDQNASGKDYLAGILNLPLPPLDLSSVGISPASVVSAQLPQTPKLSHKTYKISPSAVWTSPPRSWTSSLSRHFTPMTSPNKRSSSRSTLLGAQCNDVIWPGWCSGAGTAKQAGICAALACSIPRPQKSASLLIEATRQNNCTEIVRLINLKQRRLEEYDEHGMTALHWSCQLMFVEACQILLSHEALKYCTSSKSDYTPLYLAARNGNTKVMTLLLDHRANVNQKSKIHGASALHAAVAAGDAGCCQMLLDAGALIDAQDGDGVTPLWWAVLGNKVHVANILVDRGANVEARMPARTRFELDPQAGATMLWHSVCTDRPKLVGLLLRGGADVLSARCDGKTPLHVAAGGTGSLAVVALLLEHGADVEVTTKRGRTPLHCAARAGHERVCQLLVRCGGRYECG